MASTTVKSFSLSPPSFASNLERRAHFRHSVRCLSSKDSSTAALSLDESLKIGNGAVNGAVRERVGVGSDGPAVGEGKRREKKEREEVKLEPLWDDGYGSETVQDYLEYAGDVIKPDGGPVRWFTPISCGPHLGGSPVLFFLPGMDGLGLGLILHHKSLGKVFDVRCMHIPVKDRTPFEELVVWVERSLRDEHSSSPNKPIYLVGDSFGGCLALAVAARNPDIDLVVILANPATSFARSQLQPFLPLLEALPNELHNAVPYLLSFVMGDPLKMATVNIDTAGPPAQYFEQLANNLTAMLPRLSGLADIIPKEALLWKLKQLKTGAAYANSRLHAVKAEVLVLASGKDAMLPSKDEAWRLLKSLKNCNVRYFKDNGHTILLEDGVNLLTIIKGTGTYRRSRNLDYVMDFVPPSKSEFKQAVEGNGFLRNFTGPVFLSTTEDGKIVRGLAGVPEEGPVLLVGYHMLMGLELSPLVEQFLREKKILVRGIAHPTLFSDLVESESKEFSFNDTIRLYGALPVSASNLFKLFKTKSHVLLYPGGAREALHRKGEEYKLFWPDQPEFVRMAARFEATIVPFGVIGEDDLAELVLDYDDLMKIPYLSDQMRRNNEKAQQFNVRAGMSGEVANQELYIPGLLPKIPGRLYYLFGKPIPTKGKKEMLKDREKARELYLEIRSDVETSMSYLLKKREQDAYRSIVDRTVYRAFRAPMDQVPAFEP
ncbi:acyltransferase-like protein At1g54570, chloroplastic isoform X1 [Salvia splendens]|uniref:acyltransferase-like protein At1g54570, chloroplastic isoform X1 n=1 Tax=Salvia splendens TaxID=180675 RepID=UPI001C2758B8|nr:acyltransferase-like protein At1g54570, chloroplastic isoform X1 [Salvia splendens]XP_042055623.1 acyltransferase-like protein At1g54570, chloroplastic isoform X1 [Salvia splendens]